MKVKVQCLYERGRTLSRGERRAMPTYQGELRLHEMRSQHLGRITPVAKLIGNAEGPELDLLPELCDAAVVFMRQQTLRVRGFEMVGGIVYAQTWDVEFS